MPEPPKPPNGVSPPPSPPPLNATTKAAPVYTQPLIADVGRNETVQGQLDQILKSGSPLLENARARSMEFAASRGLQNSTLAAGAGERALIETALPIAQQDAQTH